MMKNKIRLIIVAVILIVAVTTSHSIDEREVEAKIEQTFNRAKSALEADPSGIRAQQVLNESKLVTQVIQPFLYEVPGALHEHSAERQARVEIVENLLAEYESFFVSLINTLSNPETNSSVVTNYVKFSEPSSRIKRALMEVTAADGARSENVAAAYDAVFYLELDDPSIRREIVETMEWLDKRHSKARLASKLRNLAAESWATPEMLKYWRESLMTPFVPENFSDNGSEEKLDTQYLWAALALPFFGEMENDLAMLAANRAEEIQSVKGANRTSEKLFVAAQVLEGKRPPEIAINWKGQLLGRSKAVVNRQSVAMPNVIKAPEPIQQTEVTLKSEDQISKDLSNDKKCNSSKWLVCIAAIALLIIVVILVRAAKSKSDPS